MPIKETVIIDFEGNLAEKIEQLTTDFKKLQDEVDTTNKKLEDTGKSAKKGAEGTKTLAKGFKAIGTAFKAIGIGIIVALFAKLAEILGKNQKVMDAVSNVMIGLEIAFTDLYNFVTDNFMPAFEGLKKFFDELTFDKIKTAIQENLTERFESLLDMLGYVGTAFKELFAGNWEKAAEAVGNAYKEQVDIFTGVNNSVDKLVDGTKKLIEVGGKYIKETYEQAEAITKANKAALVGAAIQAQLVEKYDIAAEKLRQTRDDESKSIADRIKANDDLLITLKKQEVAMIAEANLQIEAAQNLFNLNKNDENRIALIDAKTNKLGIQAQITGFLSEQIVNGIALTKEQIELENIATEATNARAISEAQFAAERIVNEEDRIVALQKVAQQEYDLEAARLQNIIDTTEEGTLIKVQAEQDLKDATLAINQELADSDTALKDVKVKNIEIAKKQREGEMMFALQAAGDMFAGLANLAEEGSKGQEALAIAATLTSAAVAAIGIWEGWAKLGPWGIAGAIAQSVALAASTVVAIKQIKSAKKGSGAGAGGGNRNGGTAKPSYSIVGNVKATSGGQNSTTDAVQDVNDTPIKAIVVAIEFKTDQAAERQAQVNSSI